MHERIRGLLAEHAAGGLDAERRAEVETHLAGCPNCRAELAEWQALAGVLTTEVAGRAEAAPAWIDPELSPTASVSREPSTAQLAGRPWPALLVLGLGIGILLIAGLGRFEDPTDRWVQHGVEGDVSGQILGGFDASGPGALDGAGGSSEADTEEALRIDRLPTPITRAGDPIDGLGLDGSHDANLLALARAADSGATASRGATAEAGPASIAGDAVSRSPSVSTSTAPAATANPTPAPDDGRSGLGRSSPEPSEPPPATATTPPTATSIVLPSATASPTRVTTAILHGRVHGPDGYPRAEIPILVERIDSAGERYELATDIEGRYAFELPPGSWILHAEAPAYQLMWHAGRPNPLSADPIELLAGDEQQADFFLEPHPAARIEGQLLDERGDPIPRALVMAAYPHDPTVPDASPRPVWSSFTHDDGRFALALPPGAWYLAAMPDWRAAEPSWWGGDGSLEEADQMGLSADRVPEIVWQLDRP